MIKADNIHFMHGCTTEVCIYWQGAYDDPQCTSKKKNQTKPLP